MASADSGRRRVCRRRAEEDRGSGARDGVVARAIDRRRRASLRASPVGGRRAGAPPSGPIGLDGACVGEGDLAAPEPRPTSRPPEVWPNALASIETKVSRKIRVSPPATTFGVRGTQRILRRYDRLVCCPAAQAHRSSSIIHLPWSAASISRSEAGERALHRTRIGAKGEGCEVVAGGSLAPCRIALSPWHRRLPHPSSSMRRAGDGDASAGPVERWACRSSAT